LLLTKTDLLQGPATSLTARLTALNRAAVLLTASFGEIGADQLFGSEAVPATLARYLDASPAAHAGQAGHQHAGDITSFALVRETPVRAVSLTLLLEVLAEHVGGDLLRLKGLINIAECPERPAVIHGVQHVFHPPAWLERWPSQDRRSRLILIGRNLRRTWVEALWAALDAEVDEVSGAGEAAGARGEGFRPGPRPDRASLPVR